MTEYRLTDSASIYKWYSFPNASISYNSCGELFWFLYYLYCQQEIKFWLILYTRDMTCVSRIFDSHGFTRDFLLWFLNSLEYLPCNFLLVFWLATLALTFPTIWWYWTGRAGLFLHFKIKCSSFSQESCLLVLV